MAELTEHTFSPLPAHPFCPTPEPDELVDTLRRVLQRIATGNGTSQLARYARRVVAELKRIEVQLVPKYAIKFQEEQIWIPYQFLGEKHSCQPKQSPQL